MNDSMKKIFVVLHNVHSVSKVVETAQVVYGLGYENFVVSKAEGSAAQSGIPEANKLALKMNCRFMALPNLPDVIEVLGVEKPILLVSPVLTKDRIDFKKLAEHMQSEDRTVLVVSGSNNSFSRKEMDLGQCLSLDAKVDVGSAGTAAVVLYNLMKVS